MPFEKIKRDILERRASVTAQKYGKKPEERTIEELLERGIVNVDKPKGPTSHQVSAYVRDIFGLKKSGHSGTLDPKVTGVLPVALGSSTRIVQALLVAGKEYVCLMHLHNPVEETKIKDCLDSFVGKIKQLPPIKSAVKRQWRFRKIYYIELLGIEGQDVLFKVGCQAGTYIRKLCHDMGEKLGTGAHMAQLRRTKAGPFNESTIVSLYDLKDAYVFYKEDGDETLLRKFVQPIENAVAHLPKMWVHDTTVDTLCHGADLAVPGVAKVETDIQVDELVAIMTLKDELIAFGEAKMISNDVVKKDRGVCVRIHKVFMMPGTYPKMQKE